MLWPIFFEKKKKKNEREPVPPILNSSMHMQREQGYPDPSIFRGIRENQSSGFPTMSDTNRTVQSQKLGRGLKFWILKEKRLCNLHYLCNEK